MALAIAWTQQPTNALAQVSGDAPVRIDVTARNLRSAIAELASEAHISIGTDGSLPAVRTHRVRGTMSINAALGRLLAGSGLVAQRVGPTAWRILRADSPTRVPPPAQSPAAPAQIAPMPETVPGPPIIVTATKTARNLFDLPAAVAQIDLQASGQGMPDAGSAWAATRIEGMALTASGAGRNRMFLRGVADSPFNGESQSTVAIVLDSARVTYSAPDPDIRLVDVARVEVLKGPQGSLYGTGTLGGIYRVETNRPEQGVTRLAASGGLESVGHGGLGFGGSVMANVPLAGETVALRTVGYAMREAGWVDTGSRPDSNSTMITGGRAALAIVPADHWSIDLSGLAQFTNSRDSQYVYEAGSRTRPPQMAEPHDNDIRLAAAHVAGLIGAVGVTFDTSYVRHEVRETFDATQGAGAFGVTDPRLLHDDRDYRIWNIETRLDGSLGPVDLLAGLARIEARQDALAVLETTISPAAATVDDDQRLSTETSLFGTARMALGERWSLEAGGRLFAGMVKDTRIVGGLPVTRDLHRTGFTPSLALAWQPGAGRLAYLRYGSALRQGGVDIGSNGDLESFDSDELATLEAGWRDDLGGLGLLEFGLFATRWTDMQSDMLLDTGLIETMNVGNARVMGLEAGWQADLGDRWHLAAGGTLTRARLVRDESGLEIEDRRLPVVPAYTLRSEVRRAFALGGAQASLTLRLNYTGEASLSFDPRLDRTMGDVLMGEIEGRLEWHGWQAGLAVDNLFGCRDDTFALGNRLRILAGPQFTPLRPRTLRLTLGRDF